MGTRDMDRVPLVLLSGTLCDARLWAHQARQLAGIADPLVGDLTRDDSIGAMAVGVLAAAAPRFALTGLSMGAIVAFEILRRAPERVLALALLDTNPAAPDAGQIAAWREDMRMARAGLFARFVEERWVPALLAASGGKGGLLRDAIRGMAYAVGPRGCARQLSAQIGRPDSRPSLAAIACPTLVVGGRQDTLCPPEMHEAMSAAIPNARLAIVEDCGHLSALERPEAVTALLREWLTGVMRIRRDTAPAESGGVQPAHERGGDGARARRNVRPRRPGWRRGDTPYALAVPVGMGGRHA